jgi:hypothetical protein
MSTPKVPGQKVLPEAVQRRKAAYEQLRAEALQQVLDSMQALRRQVARKQDMSASTAAAPRRKEQEDQELQKAGLLDPIAKARAEAAAMMATERERQEKLMASRAAKAARELAKVQAAEMLKGGKLAEQERVNQLFAAQQREQRAEIERRRQEQQLWRVQRARQQEHDEEVRLDKAHAVAIERAVRTPASTTSSACMHAASPAPIRDSHPASSSSTPRCRWRQWQRRRCC